MILARPEHSLFRYLILADATWHYHGVFRPSEGAESLIELEGGGSVLYLDRSAHPGRFFLAP